MNKLLTITLSILLFLLLTISGFSLFIFSQTGNDMLKPYAKERLEEKIGLPVEVKTFTLKFGRSSLDFVINKEAAVNVVSQYSLWDGSFEGEYQIKADSFTYEEIQFRAADIKGNFKGVSEDIYVDGKGTALGATLEYRFNIINNEAQKILLDMKGAQLAELLPLLGHPAFAEGKMDAEIHMPNIGEEGASGYAHIILNKAYFNRKLIQKLYGYTLPEKSYVDGTIDANLEGKEIKLTGAVQSNLFMLQIKNALLNTVSNELTAAYRFDAKDMRILTKNKLAGPLEVEGEVTGKEKAVTVTGETTTLGGKISTTFVGDHLDTSISAVPLENILRTLGYKQNFQGVASGNAKYNLKQESGVVDLDIASFKIRPSNLTDTIKMVIGKDPSRVIFSSTKFHADIKGETTAYTLHAKGTRSSIDITEGRLNRVSNTNTARFKFVYEQYTVFGKIKGTIENPKVTIDTSSLLRDKIDDKLQDKLDKVLGGKAGEFLKGLKF